MMKMSKVVKCLNCEEDMFLPPNSTKKYCSKKCGREYRKKQADENKEETTTPSLKEELKDTPPKDYIVVKTSNEKRREALKLMFICTNCLVNKYNCVTGKFVIANHEMIGSYYGKCPHCDDERELNPEMSPNMRAFVQRPEKDEPSIIDEEMVALKKVFKHYANVARPKD